MKSDLDHLSKGRQRELETVREILHEEFDKAITLANQPHEEAQG